MWKWFPKREGHSNRCWLLRAAIVAAFVVALTFGIMALTGQRAAANPGHQASDFFIFSRAEHGIFAEPNCDGSNDKQSDVSGSTVQIFGRIHSNADHAASGQNITFNDPVTFGTNDGDPPPCQVQAEPGNTYPAGFPANIVGDPSDVDGGGWPGNLSSFLDLTGGSPVHKIGFSSQAVALPGTPCDIGNLADPSDYTVNPATDGDKVICRGTGKIQLSISNVGTAADPFRITMLSHGPIQISGQHVVVAPWVHGVLAMTDQSSFTTDVSIALSGSDFDIPERAILFTPRSGQDISGSNDSRLCLQVIGQGRNKVAGSVSSFGTRLCPPPGPPPPPPTTPTPTPTPPPTPTPTPTPAPTPEVAEEVEGPTALPPTGGEPDGGSGLSWLAAIAGAIAVMGVAAIAARRWRLSTTISTRVIGTRGGRDPWTWGSGV